MLWDRDPEEFKEVEKVLEIYCREGAAANVEGVKKAFHEKAVMNGVAKTAMYLGHSRICMSSISR